MIFYDETIRQKTARTARRFRSCLAKLGIVPGIKVDTGAKPLAGFPGETITEGLDGLRERLAEYYKLGARFAKWRAVIDIGAAFPTPFCIDANAHALARYAALCQEAGIVPIVEPEVLMDGDHSHRALRGSDGRRRSRPCSTQLLRAPRAPRGHDPEAEHGHLGQEVREARQPQAGRRGDRALPASATCRPRCRASPSSRAGRAEREATEHLSLMNQIGALPWELTFSYGRALQESALEDLGRQAGIRWRPAEGVPQARAAERPRATRQVCSTLEGRLSSRCDSSNP